MTAHVIAPMPATEAAIVGALVANLIDLGAADAVGEEVPTHGRSRADVAVVSDGRLMLIEAKRTAWQRAIAQAAMNQLCCDLSYIALWSGRASTAAVAEAQRLGVGVIEVHDHGLDVILQARRGNPHEALRQATIDRLRGTGS